MREFDAARYARWSATAALLLAGLTLAAYLQRDWVRHRERKSAPPAAPAGVERESSALTFSKVDGNRTIFTVQASKSTDFKGDNASLLEDVRITIFGKTGERHDSMHAQSCHYAKKNGEISCEGTVEIELASAAGTGRAGNEAASSSIRVETRGLSFERETGIARTNQGVQFAFPGGTGQATGAEYDANEGKLELLRDVKFSLAISRAPAGRPQSTAVTVPVQVMGSRLLVWRDALELQGPATAESAGERLTAGQLVLNLTGNFQAQRLTAKGGGTAGPQPELTLKSSNGSGVLRGDQFVVSFAAAGWAERAEAAGNVNGILRLSKARQGAGEEYEWHSNAASVELWPRGERPRELLLQGNVKLTAANPATNDVRQLETSALRVSFAAGGRGRPTGAETLAAGTLTWTEPQAAPGKAALATELRAAKFSLQFGDAGAVQEMTASGGVQMERRVPGSPVQTGTAGAAVAELARTGRWTKVRLQDNVRLQQGEQAAQADEVVLNDAGQTATLSGHATIRNAGYQTSASQIVWSQATGEISATAGVRSASLDSPGAVKLTTSGPASIIADRLQANSVTGVARYVGHARFWQGDSVLQAGTIELRRASGEMIATGNVRAVFPQTAAKASAGVPRAKTPVLWHASADSLRYGQKDGRAHLERDVVVQSSEQRMQAAALDLYFARATGVPASGSNGLAAGQQITRASGYGGVVVEQDGRRATAERCDYDAAAGKFVMSGGNPTIYDASEGSTTGRQLTFFLADDTIIVESENGSRTLTKHRVGRQ